MTAFAKPNLTFFAAVAAVAMLLGAAGVGLERTSAASGGVESDSRHTTSGNTSPKYQRHWDRISRKNKRWARRTAECESGGNPKAIGGGGRYRGAFQFMRSTWKAAPKSPQGDPIKYSYKTQAVVAVALRKRDGAGHWGYCG